jgi:hypothetical protein
MTTTWLKTGIDFNFPSRTWGGIFSPPAVIISSFFRSVIFRNPLSSIIPISPEWSHPSSSMVSFVAA